jgi:hypothetical protein
MNQARPMPAAMAQYESLSTASSTETAHMMVSWGAARRVGSTNCGKKAVKNAMVFYFEAGWTTFGT